jgi:hypothetical protein
MTSRIAIGFALVAALAMPASASANHLSPTDFKNASKFCKALKAEMGETAFKQTFGTNENRSNAHGKCVSRHVRTVDEDHSDAVSQCRAEREADASAFAERYGKDRGRGDERRSENGRRHGKNRSERSAFGRCVSQKVRQLREEREDEIVNAARQCRTERAQDREAFANKYGTNENKRNAFGKCVSQTVRAGSPTPSP